MSVDLASLGLDKETVISSIISNMKTLIDHAEDPNSPDISFDQYLPISSSKAYSTVISAVISKKYAFTTTYPRDSMSRFITHSSFLLLLLKDQLEDIDPSTVKESLLSLNDEKEVKRCVEISIALSLMRSLLPGIGIPLEKRSKFVSLVKFQETIGIMQNYNRLSYITNVLSQLLNSDTVLKSIVLTNHLGDYLSALFQLIYTPLLKPGCSNKDNTFTMTEKFHARLVTERQQFKTMLSQLLRSVNQTDILKQVMILFGYCVQSGNKHVWFTNACTNILNQTLNKSNGIDILLQAMCDEDDHASPLLWKKLDVVARILATLKNSYDVTFPQVLQMLQYTDVSQTTDIQFARASCKYVYQYDRDTFHSRIFAHIVAPLVNIERKIIEQVKSSQSKKSNGTESLNQKENSKEEPGNSKKEPENSKEDHENSKKEPENSKRKEKSKDKDKPSINIDLMNSVTILYRLFSHVEGLPRELLVKYANRLFFVYVHLAENPLFTPAKVFLESLLCTMFTCFSSEQCAMILNKLIFQVDYVQCSCGRTGEAEALDEDDIEDSTQDNTDADSPKLVDEMLSFPPGSIRISTTGSVSYVPPDGDSSSVADDYEKLGQSVLALLNKRKKKEASFNLFICLLNNYTRGHFRDDMDRNVVNVKMLNDLLGDIEIGDFISTNPQHIIMFIEFLIKEAISKNVDGSEINNIDSLCTALTLLNIIKSEQNASLFLRIAPSLETLINQCKNDEVTLLAKQCLDQIKASNVQKKKGSNKLENYMKALTDACDPLLPVKAHGIASLTKLILSGDENARANTKALFVLFLENLHDKDSYLYLSSVEGLAALASSSSHAEKVVTLLTEHFIAQDREVEVRLKLGEVLMRTARHLGEMLPKYKSLFLNAFLHGCKDEDHLVRASSLSNLAEVCKLLGYRVGAILNEIFTCIKCIIRSDPCPEPRRAAVMVASFLLCGLNKDTMQVLGPVLPELYRMLCTIYDRDPDDRTRLHAQLALERLKEEVETFFRPSLPEAFATLRL